VYSFHSIRGIPIPKNKVKVLKKQINTLHDFKTSLKKAAKSQLSEIKEETSNIKAA